VPKPRLRWFLPKFACVRHNEEPANLKALLLRIAEGDRLAFGELFEAYTDRVYSYAQGVLHNAELSEDVVQEVFLKIWLRKEQVASIQNFDGYLYHATRNHTFTLLKKMAKEATAMESAGLSLSIEGRSTASEEEDIIRVHREVALAVENLPGQQKKAFDLCQVSGMKYEEAAEVMKISPLTVKAHLMAARRSLRKQLGRKTSESSAEPNSEIIRKIS
jgi:RNA polymerase sigma-70 factor (family 1)